MKSIIWLASYPKSGNTWLRFFLGNYIQNGNSPVSINEIGYFTRSDASVKAYQRSTKDFFNTSDPKQSAKLRNDVIGNITKNGADINFVKTHCINDFVHNAQIIPPKFTRSAIYIIRNPLDMVISYASHYGVSIDHAILSIGHQSNTLKGNDKSAYQFLGKWANHVTTWANVRKFPVLFLRYEDMLEDPKVEFQKVVDHIGLPADETKLKKAIEFSSFDTLRKQEEASGFIENSRKQERFFRQGTSEQWREKLSKQQVEQIYADHGSVMKKYGYMS